MADGGTAAVSELVGARALREWITGERGVYARVFLVESGASATGLHAVARHDDAILLPLESGPYGGPASAVHYSGALCEVGDELFFGERGVELQDYVAAGFVQIIGPTAVCLFDASGWQAFLDDAELARRTGVFPTALIDPRVLLADRNALTNPSELERPSVIRVRPDGRVSVGMQGEVIGHVNDLQSLLSVPVPHVAALGGIAPRAELTSDIESRAWINRYNHATDLMKMLRLTNGAAKLSGFGWSLIDDDLSDAEPLTTDPFLIETADGFVLADTVTMRRQLLSPVTATVVAVTQTSTAPEVAAARVARQLGIPASEAHTLCLQAVSALNIHFGRPADISHFAKGTGK
ncbi:daptide biosynthesis RiPP recognition protein [Microbacterium sp. SA39]|uniref:daptide biosynthesis RiPP recognition protein n=1 Tax=Microbacterium sp. SA39 TaxID=1263625 RepID=UPI0005F9D1DB|nr:daptide biosynthesis RiPP recognition protein [Microbacterium sp. SA39]KJQ54161.1 hypothetical protein RS85_02233 [Microbacterium sp. SA39]